MLSPLPLSSTTATISMAQLPATNIHCRNNTSTASQPPQLLTNIRSTQIVGKKKYPQPERGKVKGRQRGEGRRWDRRRPRGEIGRDWRRWDGEWDRQERAWLSEIDGGWRYWWRLGKLDYRRDRRRRLQRVRDWEESVRGTEVTEREPVREKRKE